MPPTGTVRIEPGSNLRCTKTTSAPPTPMPSRAPESRNWGHSHKATSAHLLDVHAIKRFSSYHTKPLPEDPQLLLSVFLRTLFLPVYPLWWTGCVTATNPPSPAMRPRKYCALCALYAAHVVLTAMYFSDALPTCPALSMEWDVYLPVVLLVVFSLGHAQIVACTSGMGGIREPHDAESSSESEDEEIHGSEVPPSESEASMQPLHAHRVNCSVWTAKGERRKRQMNLTQLRNCLAEKTELAAPSPFYRRGAIIASVIIPIIPMVHNLFRLLLDTGEDTPPSPACLWNLTWWEYGPSLMQRGEESVATILSSDVRCLPIQVVSWLAALALTRPIFLQLTAAEVTFSRRVTYARCFKALTSSQKAQRMGLPHFSLKTTENIKLWLALRGGRPWLARQPHQRAADVVGTSTFIVMILLLGVMLYEYFVSSVGHFPFTLFHWEVLLWSVFLSAYLLRFLVCGTRINAKYSGISILLTEQINVHLRIMESTESGTMTKPKMQKLNISNNVLKLSTKLLKELGKPTRISGFAMNPLLYNTVRIVLLSALSACLSDMLGFNLRLLTLTKLR